MPLHGSVSCVRVLFSGSNKNFLPVSAIIKMERNDGARGYDRFDGIDVICIDRISVKIGANLSS